MGYTADSEECLKTNTKHHTHTQTHTHTHTHTHTVRTTTRVGDKRTHKKVSSLLTPSTTTNLVFIGFAPLKTKFSIFNHKTLSEPLYIQDNNLIGLSHS